MNLMSMLWMLFSTFFKVGLFTIGGGYAMIPMIKAEMLDHGWLTVEQLVDFIAVAESTPGPFAINIATYVGTEVCKNFGLLQGILGALCATLGVVLPSFIIILLIARSFANFKNNRYVQGALNGLRPTVIGLIAAAGFSIAVGVLLPSGLNGSVPELFSAFNWRGLVICAATFAFSRWKKKWHPIFMILFAAVLGILLFGVPELLTA